MAKQYLGSQEHFEDNVNAYFDELEKQNKEQQQSDQRQPEQTPDNQNKEQGVQLFRREEIIAAWDAAVAYCCSIHCAVAGIEDKTPDKHTYFASLPQSTGVSAGEEDPDNGWDWAMMFYGALKELVDLKLLKETLYKGNPDGKEYAERKPQAWHLAKEAVDLWKKSDYGASPIPVQEYSKPISEVKFKPVTSEWAANKFEVYGLNGTFDKKSWIDGFHSCRMILPELIDTDTQPSAPVEGESLSDAFAVLQNELKKDTEPGSYYHAWQSNIAMAFFDAEQPKTINVYVPVKLKYGQRIELAVVEYNSCGNRNTDAKIIPVELQTIITEAKEVWVVVPCSERLPEFDQKCVVLDTYGRWHDAVYVGLCNGKPRFRQNIDSRPYMFSNAVSWLEKKIVSLPITT